MRQRRQWIIDKKLQGRLIFMLLLVGFLNLLFYVLTLQYFLGEMSRLQGVTWQLPTTLLHRATLVVFAIQAALLTWLGVYFSNRIAGPIYRINHALKPFADAAPLTAPPQQIKLRQHDFMQELGSSINQTLLHYHQFRGSILMEVERLVREERLSEEDAKVLRQLLAGQPS